MNIFDTITLQDVWNTDLITYAAKVWCRDNMAYLNKPIQLFGTSLKVEKGRKYKRETYVMYLQPAGKVATETLCAGARSAGCEGPCLISSGQLGMTTGQNAATKRTVLMLLRPAWFEAQLLTEIDRAERKATKTAVKALFRLNGTADIDFGHIMAQRPNSSFYDYTKLLSRVRKNTLGNYHLTFSGSMYSEPSRRALRKAVQRGYNVAVAYNTKGLTSDNIAIPEGLEDFDTTDLRPMDAVGAIGALKRKGSNKGQRAAEGLNSFFVTAANEHIFNDIIAVG